MSQASVTKRIKELESWLGARLLNRTTRRLSLTEIGASFYERSIRILEAVEEARSAAGALQTEPLAAVCGSMLPSRSACSTLRLR